MIDLFAVLAEPRRPWLDPETLKAKYHELSTRQHPDIAGASADFAEINRAYQILVDPCARLRHLLELEEPSALSRPGAVPAEIEPFFSLVGEVRQTAEIFFRKKSAAASPVARALLSTEQYRVQEAIELTLAALHGKQEALLEKLREADALWPHDRTRALAQLPALWQALGYIGKWLSLLRETLYRFTEP